MSMFHQGIENNGRTNQIVRFPTELTDQFLLKKYSLLPQITPAGGGGGSKLGGGLFKSL